jgi:hypothetical protein
MMERLGLVLLVQRLFFQDRVPLLLGMELDGLPAVKEQETLWLILVMDSIGRLFLVQKLLFLFCKHKI